MPRPRANHNALRPVDWGLDWGQDWGDQNPSVHCLVTNPVIGPQYSSDVECRYLN